MANDKENAALREELAAVPRGKRLDYLAGLPAARQARFKSILPREDIRQLNLHIDRLARQRKKPTLESWLADARDGRASTPDAMVAVLNEVFEKLRPQDAEWIRRIEKTAAAGSYSKRQRAVIEGIYKRYFVP